jgi:GntR family transcriptional repressor for pyruvate dehydrogenase complex
MTEPKARRRDAVLEHIHALLASGELRAGDRLPPERTLAAQLGVSRPSVREAIRALEVLGLLRAEVGSGPEAGTLVRPDASVGITASLQAHLAARSLPIADIVSARLLLEAWAVAEAAGRPADPQLRVAGELLEQMEDRQLSATGFHRLDADFHLALVRAADNQVVAAIMAALRDSIHDYVLATVSRLADWPTTAARLRSEHRRIYRAVLAGDGHGAAAATRQHIDGYYREVTDSYPSGGG